MLEFLGEWAEQPRFHGRTYLVGGGRLLVHDLPDGRISIAGIRGPDGELPGVNVERRDIDELVAALMRLAEPPAQHEQPAPFVEPARDRKSRLMADERQYPHLPVPGMWRKARKPHVCEHCHEPINSTDRYFEYTGEVPDFQTGSAYCRRCAILVWLDFGVQGDTNGSSTDG